MAFESLLEAKFIERKRRNPQYSIRSFARDINVHQSTLTRVLTGKRKVTNKFVQKVAPSLNLSSEELSQVLLDAREFSQTKTQKKYDDLSLCSFIVASEWYHDAILELIHLTDFQGDPKWIAQKLDLDVVTVNLAIRRLEAVNWLTINEAGAWTDTSQNNALLADELTTPSLMQYQKQVLKNSEKAINQVEAIDRSHTSLTLAANSQNMKKAKVLIHQFRHDLAKLLSQQFRM